MIRCTYQCQKCAFQFARPKPMPIRCPKCASIYVDWLNYKDVIQYLLEHDKEYREHYMNGKT